MSRTIRHNNGFNHGRDDNPVDARCFPCTSHPKGYNTLDDDHGHYGAGGHRYMKKAASAARRVYAKTLTRKEIMELDT